MTALITLLALAAVVLYMVAIYSRDQYHTRAALEWSVICAMGALVCCMLVALGD